MDVRLGSSLIFLHSHGGIFYEQFWFFDLQELAHDHKKFNEIEHAYNLISHLLPLLKQIYQKQLNELEFEVPDQG